jgi:cell wall assembly regulator SMI1
MTGIQPLIDRMDRWLVAHRPQYYAQLQSGATDADFAAFDAKFSLRLPEDFRHLYRWRNGQAATCSESLQYNRMFLSLQDSAETKELFDGMIGSDFEDPRHWRRGWVPFLHNGGGSHLCVDLNAEDGGHPGQLIAFWKADDDRPVEFQSLHAWLNDLVCSMEDGSLDLA